LAVSIFTAAFADEHRSRFRENARPSALLDVWTFLQRHFGSGFLGAYDQERLVGYALFVCSLGSVQRKATVTGEIFKWALRALVGRYDFQVSALARVVRNKVYFFCGAQRFRTHGDAQLLNVAVDPAAQGRGIAKVLVRAGLEAMSRQGVPEVRLEVRPWNTAAVKVYERTGWREVGRTRDLDGEWVVMTVTPSLLSP